MKDLKVYYILMLGPIPILQAMNRFDLVDSATFVASLIFYLFVYRTYIDGKRLTEKNLIPESAIWKLIIPGYRVRYLKELYLK